MTLGQKIKKLRNTKNLTQKELADQIHVTFQTVSKWESDTNEPDVSTLRELAKIFNCSVDYLISVNDEEVVEQVSSEEVDVVPAIVTKPEEDKDEDNEPSSPLHICVKCGKQIPESELAVEDITKKERHGKHIRTIVTGQKYYHKQCLEEIKKERVANNNKKEKHRMEEEAIKCFGWSIALGVVGLGVSLAIFLCNT